MASNRNNAYIRADVHCDGFDLWLHTNPIGIDDTNIYPYGTPNHHSITSHPMEDWVGVVPIVKEDAPVCPQCNRQHPEIVFDDQYNIGFYTDELPSVQNEQMLIHPSHYLTMEHSIPGDLELPEGYLEKVLAWWDDWEINGDENDIDPILRIRTVG